MFVHSFVRSFVCSFVFVWCSFVFTSFLLSFVRAYLRSFVHSFVVRSLARSLVRTKVHRQTAKPVRRKKVTNHSLPQHTHTRKHKHKQTNTQRFRWPCKERRAVLTCMHGDEPISQSFIGWLDSTAPRFHLARNRRLCTRKQTHSSTVSGAVHWSAASTTPVG